MEMAQRQQEMFLFLGKQIAEISKTFPEKLSLNIVPVLFSVKFTDEIIMLCLTSTVFYTSKVACLK